MEHCPLLMRRRTRSKCLATVASIWIQCTSGSLYTFSIYSSILKSTQSYTQSTLDTISVFKDIGANSGVLAGLLYTAVTPNNSHGPWIVLVCGAIQCFLGYFLMYLSVVGVIPRPHVLAMCLFMFLAAHAQTFFNTANVVTAVNNFPRYSGTSVGIMKGFLGLSGAILIQVYQTIFKSNPASFLLMLALLPSINSILLMPFVRICNTDEGDEKKYLNGFSLVAMLIAVYLMVVIILEKTLTIGFSAQVITIVMLLILLMSPLHIAIGAHQEESYRVIERDRLIDNINIPDAGKTCEGQSYSGYNQIPSNSEQESATPKKHTRQWIENLNLLEAMCSPNFWFLFLAMASGMGSGLATVNNIAQIGGSLGYKNSETSTLVSLWSIWNFLGRFGAGYVSDYFLHTSGWARPIFMAITLAAMSIGHVVIASGLPGALYAGSILVGVCYGSQWSLMPTIASEIFGVQHMGTIFNAIAIASPIGSYVLSVRVVGYVYDTEAAIDGHTCIGVHCFMLSFYIMASSTLLGFLAAIILYFRTRRFYSEVVLGRLQSSLRY
ncbi:Major facilitator superfamily [Dillenia turbinata]|uniref:Major facilitator superfamily n=1 Tax=Dillenia turbinata TaxID=194707 RepID=A0AAN8V4W5_9MAGN